MRWGIKQLLKVKNVLSIFQYFLLLTTHFPKHLLLSDWCNYIKIYWCLVNKINYQIYIVLLSHIILHNSSFNNFSDLQYINKICYHQDQEKENLKTLRVNTNNYICYKLKIALQDEITIHDKVQSLSDSKSNC